VITTVVGEPAEFKEQAYMRKSVQYVLIAVIVALIGATGMTYYKYRQATDDYAKTKAAEESARERYAQSIQAIVEIQESLSAITLGDEEVKMQSDALQTERDLSDPDGSAALERIAALRESIDRTKERIRALESDLEKSGVKMDGLNRMVANLKKTVAEKETYITSLQTQVAGLETTVELTNEQLTIREQELEDTQKRLAMVYYVIGTKKDLTESGVIEAHGGLLGIGKTLQPSPSADETNFTALDTDYERIVRIEAAKAKVLSAQPSSSYELRPVENGVELHIIDPEQFRKVKQLIILTA